MRNIGLDLGSTTTIAAEVANNQVVTNIVPSVVSPTHLSHNELTEQTDYIGTNGNGSLQRTHVSLQGYHYWAGHGAWNGRNTIQRFDDKRFYQREQVLLSLLAIAGLPDANGAGFAVQMAVPQNLTIDETELALLREQMRTAYLGKHHLAINGKKWVITIKEINLDSQPKMAFFDLGFNTKLAWVLGPDFKHTDKFVLFDQGGNDFGILSIENGQVVDDKSEEKRLGMTTCAKELQKILIRSYGLRDLTVWECDELIQQAVKHRNGDDGARAMVKINGYPRNVTQEASKALEQFIPLCVNFAHDVVGEASTVGKMIAGGGAYALHRPLSELFGHITKPTGDPIVSIASGAAKVAQWKFR